MHSVRKSFKVKVINYYPDYIWVIKQISQILVCQIYIGQNIKEKR